MITPRFWFFQAAHISAVQPSVSLALTSAPAFKSVVIASGFLLNRAAYQRSPTEELVMSVDIFALGDSALYLLGCSSFHQFNECPSSGHMSNECRKAEARPSSLLTLPSKGILCLLLFDRQELSSLVPTLSRVEINLLSGCPHAAI